MKSDIRSLFPRSRAAESGARSGASLPRRCAACFTTCRALLLLLFFAVGCAAAQTPQFSLGTAAADSVPQTTVVAVQQPAVQLVEHTTVYEEESGHKPERAERRVLRARAYAARIDSLVQSRNYMFFPNSMQELPGGLIRSIYADYFFFGLFVDHVGVHLPTERGLTQYVEMLNFDSMSLRGYRAARLQRGWSVSFDVADGDRLYHVDLAISTVTGETVLTLITPTVTMRYVGWLWDKRVDNPKFRRM